MENKIQFKDPWYKTDQDLSKQLKLEVADTHILANKNVKTIARREDNDDVLYEIIDQNKTFAIVHLTWNQSKQTDPRWPITKLFKNIKEVQNQINIDNQDWE